jgi:hypothetical protein
LPIFHGPGPIGCVDEVDDKVYDEVAALAVGRDDHLECELE